MSHFINYKNTNNFILKSLLLNEGLADDVDAEAEEVLNELNLLTESEDAQNELRAAGVY